MKNILKTELHFSRLLNNNNFVKIISIFIGVVIWLVVVINFDGNGDVVISNIPVVIDPANSTLKAYDLSVIDGNDQKISASITGKLYKLGNLTEEDFIAVPTLSTVTRPGEHEVQVVVKKANERDLDYEVVPTTNTVKVKFDRLKSQDIPLKASAENITAPVGFIREEPFANVETVTVNGPESEIEKIANCVVKTSETAVVSETSVFDGELMFYDVNNSVVELEYVTYEQQEYEVTVPINKLKTVKLVFNYVNIPQGINLEETPLKTEMSQDTIQIAGPSKVIDTIEEISLGEIDFRKIDIGHIAELQVNMPAGVINVDNVTSVMIDFTPNDLSPEQFTIQKDKILLRNIPVGYEVKLASNSIYNVKMVGAQKDIEDLEASEIVAFVDFSGKEIAEGSSRVPVQIYVLGNKFAWAVGEYRVAINATKK